MGNDAEFKIYRAPLTAQKRGKAGRGTVSYPFCAMAQGDCFDVESTPETAAEAQRRLLSAARGFAHRHGGGRKFTTRVRNDGSAVTIWRII